ncbi:uncharacterized protein LOC62_06G008744 [Vanrija pseudolonga]|uniref:Uncharacterized protein n=1 Tax=Vanrija pseudolonga TaxID=143232 RepID=A0AAF1BTV1_9TREE|nr:hypothetical protein LOC62_06G008744 [Vanrija pseudolonga]
MFSPAYTRPPKPPGTRRAGLRSTDSQAPPLASKHDLFKPTTTTTSSKASSPLVPKSAKGKVKAASPLKESTAAGDDDHDDQAASDDSDATHVSPHNNTRAPRPLSLISESSAPMVSPPPPYGYRRTSTASPLADVKRPLVHNVPPPPEPLESGPSSVRTSMISVDNVDLALEVDDDDDEPGNTLTLRGVQRLIKQQELDAMADEISSRLMLYASPPRESPRASTATNRSPIAERRPLSKSPSGGSRYQVLSPKLGPLDKTPPHLRTVPSDPSLAFSHPQPRAPSDKLARGRDVRLSMLRAEEDEARILELEDALAEARDSEENQRRAAARLRRDMDKLRRQLERAEDAALERERLEYALAAATLEMSNRREQRSYGRSNPIAFAVRSRGGYDPPSSEEDDRVGWGSTTFPEFPRDRLAPFDDPRYAHHQELYEPSSAQDQHGSSQGTESVRHEEVDLTDLPMTLLDRPRSRPTVSSATFLSPDRGPSRSVSHQRLPLTPRLQVDAPSSSIRGRSDKGSLRLRRTPYPASRPAPSEGSFSLHRRVPSTTSTGSVRSRASIVTNSGRSQSPQSGISGSPLSGIASRMGSVRSFLSDDYLGVRRSLGSELGSNYAPSPMTNFRDLDESPDENEETTEDEHFEDAEQHLHEDEVQQDFEDAGSKIGRPIVYKTPENQLSNQLSISLTSPKVTSKGSLSPTAAFVLRGQLARHLDSSAYDSITETGAPRRIRWADWSPRSWPSPSPQPRHVPLPGMEDDDVPVIAVHPAATQRFQVAAPGDTDSPILSPAHLAPAGDPWDEYSDRSSLRATPSPRTRIKNAKHLRPLVLCTTPVVQARDNTLALAAQHRRYQSTSAAPTATVSHVVPIGHRRALSNAPNLNDYRMFTGRSHPGPTTIPGRVMHDFFCLTLLFLDYLEWAIILFWRLFLDIRAGPDYALGPQRRNHKKRFYI